MLIKNHPLWIQKIILQRFLEYYKRHNYDKGYKTLEDIQNETVDYFLWIETPEENIWSKVNDGNYDELYAFHYPEQYYTTKHLLELIDKL